MIKICQIFCPYYHKDKQDIGYCYPSKIAHTAEIRLPESYEFQNKYPALKVLFCPRCGFYPGDCDFHNQPAPGKPCGGYIYFEYLLDKGVIDLERVARLCEALK